MNRDKAIFWLNRRIRELEAKAGPPDQKDMAEAGLSYSDRQALMADRAHNADSYQGELSSLKEVVAFIQEKA